MDDINNLHNRQSIALDTVRRELEILQTESDQAETEVCEAQLKFDAIAQFQALYINSSNMIVSAKDDMAATASTFAGKKRIFQEFLPLFESVSQQLTGALSASEGINIATNKAAHSITELENIIEEVSRSVEVIDSVAEQANLLAINSAAEAANVGEQGRGFAIVADEVHKLAQHSADVTQNMGALMGAITHHLNAIGSTLSTVAKNNTAIHKTTADVLHINHKAVDVTNNMLQLVTDSTQSTFVQTVKMEHVVWKADIYKVLAGLSCKRIDEFADHSAGSLGQWFSNYQTRPKCAVPIALQRLEKSHINLHQQGTAALSTMQQGNYIKMVTALESMEHASEVFFDCLPALAENLKQI